MSVWEYKVISSGKGGFATPALMEAFLNQLGKDEWEIIHFHTPADNALAFTGLARRSTQRDWTLEDAVAAAARAEAEKLRSEFEAKFRGSVGGGGSGAADVDKPETLAAEKANADDGLRKLRDTDRDQEEGSDDEPAAESEPDEWQKLAKEEELPSFFEAIQPLMRRNQRGAGMSVGVDHLAKKWGMSEDDIMGALKECGFVVPEDEDEAPAYLEYDGDLFWVNVNRRGEVWVNTKEKPRAVFKAVKAERFTPEVKESAAVSSEGTASAAAATGEPAAAANTAETAEAPAGSGGSTPAGEGKERGERPDRPDRPDRHQDRNQSRHQDQAPKPGHQPNRRGLPEGEDLLNRIKPLMRRARGGEGGSGSVGFLSRGLKCRENELMSAFAALGLTLSGAAGEPAPEVVIGDALWWLNKDHRGGVWINARKPGTAKTAGSEGSAPAGGTAPAAAPEAAAATPAEVPVVVSEAPLLTPAPVAGEPAPAEAEGRRLSDVATEAAIALSSEAPAMPPVEEPSAEPAAEAAPVTEPVPASSAAPAAEPEPLAEREVTSDFAPTETTAPAGPEVITQPSAEPVSAVPALIAQLRPLLKETRTGTLAGEVSKLAESLGQDPGALLASLGQLGLSAPENPKEKGATLEFGGEPVWLSKNAKDELFFNAKPVREAAPERKPRKGKRPAAEEPPPAEPV